MWDRGSISTSDSDTLRVVKNFPVGNRSSGTINQARQQHGLIYGEGQMANEELTDKVMSLTCKILTSH